MIDKKFGLLGILPLVLLAGCSPTQKPKVSVTQLKCSAGKPGLVIKGMVKNTSGKMLLLAPSYTLLSSSGGKLLTSGSGNALGNVQVLPASTSTISFAVAPKALAGGGPDSGEHYWNTIHILHETSKVKINFNNGARGSKDYGEPIQAVGENTAACPSGPPLTEVKTSWAISKALKLSKESKIFVYEYYNEYGTYPKDNNVAGTANPASISDAAVAQVAIGGNGKKPGTIAVQFRKSAKDIVPKLKGSWLYLKPVEGFGHISYKCSGTAVDLGYLTHACKPKHMPQ